jgi:Phosphatidylinositol kinase and protein kinases of the PI-3 kinase family
MCPEHHRKSYLMDRLEELNRRLRRRMITKGNVSLDVEDNRGPHDWPTLGDLSPDCMKYSIHFPLEPTATIWPGGGRMDPSDWRDHARSPLLKLKTEQGVMRVLNIVSSKSRVLASRERCPYLVHCEVLETGLEGRDARLYASSSGDLGVTLQEALGMAGRKQKRGVEGDYMRSFTSYKLPPELTSSDVLIPSIDLSTFTIQDDEKMFHNAKLFPRGGDQQGSGYYYNHDSIIDESIHSRTPYDLVLEERLQQLHNHMQTNHQRPQYGPLPPSQHQLPSHPYDNMPKLTTYSTLLNRVYGKPWAETCEEIRQTSPYGNVKGWRLASFIMKAGEDIRREALVMQVIAKMKTWFDTDIPLQNRPFLKPYTIMCVGGDAGLLECLRDAKSVDEVKKSTDGYTTLRDYFERAYGPPTRQMRAARHHPGVLSQPQENPSNAHLNEITFERAQDNFLRSLVGYSLICYILQIKDRHNANILLDRQGHIMHIDFGFVLGDTPKMGKVPLFSERAPSKLTQEFWEVIGGWNFHEGGLGVRFCKMFEDAFACASAHSDELVSLIEAAILNLTKNPNEARIIASGVRNRLRMRGRVGSVQQKTFIMDLVNTALTSWGTSTYDWLQKSMNGYI